MEPACVNVCPEHAIISGDMEDETTEIAQLLARQAVNVRKPEKGTKPNLFYIGADEVSLNPTATPRTGEYLWSGQTTVESRLVTIKNEFRTFEMSIYKGCMLNLVVLHF